MKELGIAPRRFQSEGMGMAKEKRITPRPVLHYLGSKWAIAPWVIAHFPAHTTYVEPFGGGAAALLRKTPSPVEVYNDLDRAVVGFWRVLRSQPKAFVRALKTTPWARDEYRLAWEPCEDELESARRFFVRCWMSYMGATDRPNGWRVNARTRSGFVPQWGQEDRLLEVASRWRSVQIEHDDALAVIRRFDGPNTLHYCDPPYLATTRSSGCNYTCEMDDARHRELLDQLNAVQGRVVLSGYPSKLYERQLRGWRCIQRQARTRAAKTVRTECLWIRP